MKQEHNNTKQTAQTERDEIKPKSKRHIWSDMEQHVARCSSFEQGLEKQSKRRQNKAKRRQLEQDAVKLHKRKKNGATWSKRKQDKEASS